MKTTIAALSAIALLPTATATEISVIYSDDFSHDLAETYGDREGEYLATEIIDDMKRALNRAGVSPTRIEVVIETATPNRPTLKQLADEPGLDGFRSISLGGMALAATAYDPENVVLGEHAYEWFESDIEDVIGSATWSDASRASRRFARKFANHLTSE